MPKPTTPPVNAPGLLASDALQEVMAFARDGQSVPDRVLLMRFGSNKMRDGRAPVILKDRTHAEKVIATTRAFLGSARFNFDYDHQAVKIRDQSVAAQAKASGWAKDFEIDDEGIWASQVEWTPTAAAAIADKEYLYVSPYFLRGKASGDLFRFTNAALTNLPALELEALAASLDNHTTEEDDNMNLTAIAASLGLPKDADEAAVLAAIKANSDTMAAVSAALGVAEGGDILAAATEAVAASAAEPDPKKYAPVEVLEEMRASMAPLKAAHNKRLIDDAVTSGKVTPAERGWADGFLAKYGEEEFASTIKDRPAIAGGRVAPKGEGGGSGVLTEEQEELCASMGWDKAEYLKTLSEETGV